MVLTISCSVAIDERTGEKKKEEGREKGGRGDSHMDFYVLYWTGLYRAIGRSVEFAHLLYTAQNVPLLGGKPSGWLEFGLRTGGSLFFFLSCASIYVLLTYCRILFLVLVFVLLVW